MHPTNPSNRRLHQTADAGAGSGDKDGSDRETAGELISGSNSNHRRLMDNLVLQPAYVVTSLQSGVHLTKGYGQTIYIADGNNAYINATDSSDLMIEEYLDFRSHYFLTTAVQLGYSYSICNGNNTHYTVTPSLVTDFYSQCGQKNG